MKMVYIGKSCVSFENGRVYEVDELMSDGLGNYHDIIDESGEWYRYSERYVKHNFVIKDEGEKNGKR
mgnify:CR=1 FL=1